LSSMNQDFTPAGIKAIRLQLGLTQVEFGARLGISQKAVSAWEINGLPKRYRVVLKLLELDRQAARRQRR
jgi:DNA-binding transcriptional regulator YiaG